MLALSRLFTARFRTPSQRCGVSAAVPSALHRVTTRHFSWSACQAQTDVSLPFETTACLELVPESKPHAVYQILNVHGAVVAGAKEPEIRKDVAQKMYVSMVKLSILDTISYEAQRQGRISFYLTHTGEEAVSVASAAALVSSDIIFAQYREAGALLYRGFTILECMHQNFASKFGHGKGRQMPIHYGSAKLNYVTISSPLATQLPQAAGAAYGVKLDGAGRAVLCVFGDGAASEGDFHAALNFAATLACPVIFLCRNNQYAISTPAAEQFHGAAITARAAGYGIPAIRVDGSDALAMYAAIAHARDVAHTKCVPVLVEALTYRLGHHSTSDDSTRYRSAEEIKRWRVTTNPIERMRAYVMSKGWWDAGMEERLQVGARQEVLNALEEAEMTPKPALAHLFTDVYDELPPHLQAQQQQLLEHLHRHGQHYALHGFDGGVKTLE